jgi:hypothetical protein
MMKRYLIYILIMAAFRLQSVAQYKDVIRAGDHTIHTFESYGWVTKGWVRYTLRQDGTASAYRDGFPQNRHKAHVYIEDTVVYKKKKYVVTEIEGQAWRDAIHVLSFRLPQNLTAIAVEAFRRTYGIDSIDIPPKVAEIELYAFYNSGIRSVRIPESVKTIGSYAFADCARLTSVVLPAGLESIYKYAFAGCRELKTVKVQARIPPPHISVDILGKLPLPTPDTPVLLVPKGSLQAYQNAKGWNKFPAIQEYGVSDF